MDKPKDYMTGVSILPIPDGLAADGSLRVALVIAPSSEGPWNADLAHWPAAVAGLAGATAGSSTLRLALFDDEGKPVSGKPVIVPALHASIRLASAAAQAESTWTRLFGQDLQLLHDIVTEPPDTGANEQGAASETYQYRAGLIGDVLSQLRSATIGPTLMARLRAAEMAPAWKLSPPGAQDRDARIAADAQAPFRFLFDRILLNTMAPALGGISSTLPVYKLYDHGKMDLVPTALNTRSMAEFVQRDRRNALLRSLNGTAISAAATGSPSVLQSFLPLCRDERADMIDHLLLGGAYTASSADKLPFARDLPLAQKIAYRLQIELGLYSRELGAAFGPARGARGDAGANGTALMDGADERKEAVRNRYNGLLARPAVAKLLNLIVDITIPAAIPPSGFLKVYFEDGGSAASPLVAYKYLPGDAFRPGASHEGYGLTAQKATGALSLPLESGFVRLDPNRFTLASTDVHALVNAKQVRMQELYTAQVNGANSSTLSPRQVEERSRGIQLLDEEGMTPTVAAQLFQHDAPEPVYAERLVAGYRVFVRRTAGGEQRPWRSLMARSVDYEPVAALYTPGPGEVLAAWKPYEEFREREHGVIRPLPREDADENGKPRMVAASHVFSWNGDSLALPAPPDEHSPPDCGQVSTDLANIGYRITYDYDPGPEYRLPALRVGSGYQVGLAPVYLHGGGPVLAEAQKAFARNANLVLGDCGGPFRYGRATDVQAPTVLVSPRDKMASNGPMPRNEHLDRVVLRTGAREDKDKVLRFFVPPRLDFTTAEQYAIFDHDNSNRPGGAFTRFDLHRSSGEFAAVEKPGPQNQGARIPVLREREGNYQPEFGYFPDPAARNLGLAFERDERTPEGFPDLLPPLSFWAAAPRADACLDAEPVEIQVQRWPAAERGGRLLREDSEGGKGQRAIIQLAPAEEVTLWAWCWPDLPELFRSRPALPALLMKHFFASDTVLARKWLAQAPDGKAAAAALTQQFAGVAAADGLAADTWHAIESALFHKLPLNGVTGWRKLTLVHAVAKPRRVPTIPSQDQHLDFLPLRLLQGKSMARHLDALKKTASPLHGSDDPGGSVLSFAGHLQFDRASTRALRVEANWPVLDRAHAVRNTAREGEPPHYVFEPPRMDQMLFEISDIPREPGRDDMHTLSLLADETGRLRELRSRCEPGISATAACRLDLRIVATSRFDADFAPEGPNRPPSEPGKFEVESRRFRGPGVEPARATGQRYEVILPATVRPPAPVPGRIEWCAPERRARTSAERVLVHKHYHPRLYLADAYVSGEDELFAVVFLPQGVIKDKDYQPENPALLADFADEFARMVAKGDDRAMLSKDYCAMEDNPLCKSAERDALPYVTRWGADPAAAPQGRMEALISPNRFSGHVGAVSSVSMPPPGARPGPEEPVALKVGALLYQPKLDPANGQWYIDIGIDPGAAHAPFVRLALARYQPHALNGKNVDLRLSAPVLIDPIRVPAARTVEVLHPPGKPIVANVYGVGYVRREPFGVSQAVRHLTDMPLQNIELMRRAGDRQAALLPAFGPDGSPLSTAAVLPTTAGPLLHWRSVFERPPAQPPQHYALLINEVDMHIPDRVIDRRNAKGEPGAAQSADELVQRPSFFSITVDLHDEPAAFTN